MVRVDKTKASTLKDSMLPTEKKHLQKSKDHEHGHKKHKKHHSRHSDAHKVFLIH